MLDPRNETGRTTGSPRTETGLVTQAMKGAPQNNGTQAAPHPSPRWSSRCPGAAARSVA